MDKDATLSSVALGFVWPSLSCNMAFFLLPYSVAYAIWYVFLRDSSVVHRLKFNPKYPDSDLIVRELRRCFVSVFICTAFDVLLRTCYQVGLTPGKQSENFWSDQWTQGSTTMFATAINNWKMAVFLVVWSDTHFYFIHRLLHESKWLYKNVHKIHHESRNPNPFSGLSFHPIESSLYFSNILIAFIVPLEQWQFDILRVGLLLAPLPEHVGHGFKGYPWGYGHYIHHTTFNYNFASGLFPCHGIWDNVFGTGYREGSKATLNRSDSAKAQAAQIKEALS